MARIFTLAITLAVSFFLYTPLHAQVGTSDDPAVFVPVISETYTISVSLGEITGTISVTVKGSNILSIDSDMTDLVIGEVARVQPITHTVEPSRTHAIEVNLPEFPAGTDDTVDVVEIRINAYDKTWDTNSVDVVIRNNTSEIVGPFSLTAEAYSEDGEFLGEGSNSMILYPSLLEPGQLTFGSISFKGIELYESDRIEVNIEKSFGSSRAVALTVDSWKQSTRSGKSVTGTISNPWDFPVEIDKIKLLCFDEDRIPSNAWYGGNGESPATSLLPGESAPFQINSNCHSFILSATGKK